MGSVTFLCSSNCLFLDKKKTVIYLCDTSMYCAGSGEIVKTCSTTLRPCFSELSRHFPDHSPFFYPKSSSLRLIVSQGKLHVNPSLDSPRSESSGLNESKRKREILVNLINANDTYTQNKNGSIRKITPHAKNAFCPPWKTTQNPTR